MLGNLLHTTLGMFIVLFVLKTNIIMITFIIMSNSVFLTMKIIFISGWIKPLMIVMSGPTTVILSRMIPTEMEGDAVIMIPTEDLWV